ncbi:MAG: Fmu (Sun) domain-containing protein [Chitinophagaceae bacterium]|nr:MAG: Fmu (Sun) domain-containing protein [Chitinophagaceae bacterium]
MIHLSHLKTAVKILESYSGGQPFSIFLREFFRADKKYGSRDRKQVARLCYSYFRIGRVAAGLPIDERILLGVFLCGQAEDEFQPDLKPLWAGHFNDPLPDKCRLAGITYRVEDQFPFSDAISSSINTGDFAASHFIQPDLFIRIRPGKVETIHEQVNKAGIGYREISPSSLAFPNTTKLDGVITADTDAVIQDLSSQRVATLFTLMNSGDAVAAHGNTTPVDATWSREAKHLTTGRPLKVWDCCAASGGKSIMAVDYLGDIDLTVSDIRQNILVNLQQRFARAGIKKYRSLVADLGVSAATGKGLRGVDLIIADVPCSGSGTWGRTPEHLFYFTREKMEYYSQLQKKIIDNSLPSLADGGHYLYITCSVYKNENEEAVSYLSAKGLTLKHAGYFPGYGEKADTLFAALFVKQ